MDLLLNLMNAPRSGSPLIEYDLQVRDKPKDILTTERGEYWRLLVPGTYFVKVSMEGREDTLIGIWTILTVMSPAV